MEVLAHMLTGKARRTLNFCAALCSGSVLVTLNFSQHLLYDPNEFMKSHQSELKSNR